MEFSNINLNRKQSVFFPIEAKKPDPHDLKPLPDRLWMDWTSDVGWNCDSAASDMIYGPFLNGNMAVGPPLWPVSMGALVSYGFQCSEVLTAASLKDWPWWPGLSSLPLVFRDCFSGDFSWNSAAFLMKQGAATRRAPRRDLWWGPGLGVSRKY